MAVYGASQKPTDRERLRLHNGSLKGGFPVVNRPAMTLMSAVGRAAIEVSTLLIFLSLAHAWTFAHMTL